MGGQVNELNIDDTDGRDAENPEVARSGDNPAELAGTAELMRLEELLRQQRETFDQRKEQEARWFNLRIRMAYIAVVMLPSVAIVCTIILFDYKSYNHIVVSSAGGALFVDVLGLLAAAWKFVLSPSSITQLKPTVSK